MTNIIPFSALTSREEVLEEAASIAEQNSFMCLHGRNPKSVKSDIAAAIRALKVKP